MPSTSRTRDRRRSRRKPRYEWDAARVRALREHLGITQAELADEVGTLQQTISGWECGYHYPRGASVKMLNLVAEKAQFKYGASASESETGT